MELVSARRDVALVRAEYRLSERHACRLLELDRSTYRYEARRDANAKLRAVLVALARQKLRYGYRRLWAILRKRRWEVNVKRIYRLYREQALMVRRTKRKRLTRAAPGDSQLSGPNPAMGTGFHLRRTGEWPCLTSADHRRLLHP
jgi:helix-turn-helix protein